MKRKIDMLEVTLILLVAFIVIITGMIAANNTLLFYVEGPAALLLVVFAISRIVVAKHDSREFLEHVSRNIGGGSSDTLIKFPMAVAVVDENQKFVWSNSVFQEHITKDEELYGILACDVFEGLDIQKTFLPGGCGVSKGDDLYSVFGTSSKLSGEKLYALYFVDRSSENKAQKLYEDSRPAVLSIVLDNLEDLFANCKESERSRIMGDVEKLFEDFSTENHALIRRYETSKYLAVVEDKYFRKMIENRFSILDNARKIVTSEGNPVTLSIGAANSERSLEKLSESANAALEMSLGRGGDQAAVKTANGYEFYGGFAKGVEKRTKVKTRVVAAALSDLLESSSTVFVMGHRMGDLDCIGAGYAMAEACRDKGKNSFLVVNREKCLATALIDKVEKNGILDIFISPEEALAKVDDNSLLIIVDTHVRPILESQELYASCRNVVVIDHHRRMVGSIDNAVIFYHEPHASSASEMVTELLQYLDTGSKMSKLESEALLAGIILDTKSFSMRCGVRTFEAAAYLKKIGADTVNVKQLFSSSLTGYQHRSNIVSEARIYRKCAISCCSENYDDLAVVAPQAADELLTIEGADSSVVMYKTETGVSFCARSLGTMNVQIIMESLGGGGHQTMAGAQMEDVTLKQAAAKLSAAIDDYYDKAEGHSDNIN